jgi:hypothetical protein
MNLRESTENLTERIQDFIHTGESFNTRLDEEKTKVTSLAEILGVTTQKTEALSKQQQIFADETKEATGRVISLSESLRGIPKEINTRINIVYHSTGTGAAGGTQGSVDQRLLLDGYNFVGAKPPGKQSGGINAMDGFIPDLGLYSKKGEAFIPASIVKAIKENRGSFAGLGSDGGSVSNYFNIGELVVREEADVERIAQELYSMQISSLRGAGIR